MIVADPERDDDDEENDVPDVPNTPDAHPGVDDGFFPGVDPSTVHHNDDLPELGPRIGGDDTDVHQHDKGVAGNPPNGVIPRRPSVTSNFPYGPGFNPNVVS